jgi:hypothetical protein
MPWLISFVKFAFSDRIYWLEVHPKFKIIFFPPFYELFLLGHGKLFMSEAL